jgi:hypothetical protein
MDTTQRLVEIAEGVYVEQDVLNIVDKIRAYDPNLKVKFCNPELAETGDAPYKIVEVCSDGIERIVFSVWQLDDKVMERLYAADNSRTNVLVDIHNNNLLAKKIEERRYQEEKEEDRDLIASYLKSPKGQYSFRRRQDDALVIVDDQEGRKHKVIERR